jgi:4-hydroxybenzoate polyprenyltransferase
LSTNVKAMLKQSTWLHLRLPFSFYLMPVYLFALSVADSVYIIPAILVFVALHFFLYPASNAFNSYFDKDEESIGGLEKPPPVSKELYYTANVLDMIALLIGVLVSWKFCLMLLIYSLVSRAYSHPSVRLKRYPIISWLVAGFFQGFFTFAMVYIGISQQALEDFWKLEKILPALLSSMLLWGSYPLTQVYQHREDARRGDYTVSLMLGVKGTFYFASLVFLLANAGFLAYYTLYFSLQEALLFQAFLLPMLAYFFYWFLRVHKNITMANFRHTMWLSTISAICLNLFFTLFRLVH